MSDERKNEKSAAKKVVLIVLIAAVVITALYFLPYDKILAALFPKEEPQQEDIYFYEPDFERNILLDPAYLAMDRYISFRKGSETFVVTDGDYEKLGKDAAVIAKYIDALVRGDAKAYNALFTESYLKENGKQAEFPMQKIYGISAELYGQHTFTEEELDGKYTGVTQYRYQLNYCIDENDGTVRRDMGSGVSAPIFLELLSDPETGAIRINSIAFLQNK